MILKIVENYKSNNNTFYFDDIKSVEVSEKQKFSVASCNLLDKNNQEAAHPPIIYQHDDDVGYFITGEGEMGWVGYKIIFEFRSKIEENIRYITRILVTYVSGNQEEIWVDSKYKIYLLNNNGKTVDVY